MSHPYICATCRFHSLLRSHTRVVYSHRQWLSQTSSARRGFQNRQGVSGLSERTFSSDRDGRATPRQNDSNREVHTERRAQQLNGRYSGKPLLPQQLLAELDRPVDVRQRPQAKSADQNRTLQRFSHPQEGSEAEVRRSRPGRISLERPPDGVSSELWKKVRRFVHGTADLLKEQKHSDGSSRIHEQLWGILKEILQTHHGLEELKSVGQERPFDFSINRWIQRVAAEWKACPANGQTALHVEQIPSPLSAYKAITSFRASTALLFPPVLAAVTTRLAHLHGAGDQASEAEVFSGIRELMGLWNVCMAVQLHHGHQNQGSALLENLQSPHNFDWSFLPDPIAFSESLQQQQAHKSMRRSFPQALELLLPKPRDERMPTKRTSFDYSCSALVTLDLLRSLGKQMNSSSDIVDYEPWADLINAILRSVGEINVPLTFARKAATDPKESTRKYYSGLIKRMDLVEPAITADGQFVNSQAQHQPSEEANEVDFGAELRAQGKYNATPQQGEARDDSRPSDASLSDRFTRLTIKRLGRAIEQEDLSLAQKTHRDVQRFEKQNPSLQLRPQIYEHLMLTFLTLRNPQLTVEVWNQMINAGHKPSSKTYTVLMRGSQRDPNIMEGFWSKMRQTGVQPDVYAWSTRLFGLLKHRSLVDTGLRALGEMGQEWIAAAKSEYSQQQKLQTSVERAHNAQMQELLDRYKGDVNGVPRPNLAIMNSCTSALANTRDEVIPKILSWGLSFGVEPDLTTYNTLLNISLRHGRTEEAQNILKRMNERGIKADGNTWNVLLTAMLESSNFDELEPQEQEDKVLAFISSLEDANATNIDQKGYALLINRLLQRYSNTSAAQAVLTHMLSRNVHPTVHIYTILMSAYFQEVPPNFVAVESLWTRIQSAHIGYGDSLDSGFYDFMVERYATHHGALGSTQPMLQFLTRMEKEGKRPSWRTLEFVARALAQRGEWERLAQVVDRTRRRLREDRSENESPGQRMFWQFIVDTGLLRHEGAGSADQAMNANRA